MAGKRRLQRPSDSSDVTGIQHEEEAGEDGKVNHEVKTPFSIKKALAAAEAENPIGFRDADTLRNRAIAAVGERRQRLLSKGIRVEEKRGEMSMAFY